MARKIERTRGYLTGLTQLREETIATVVSLRIAENKWLKDAFYDEARVE